MKRWLLKGLVGGALALLTLAVQSLPAAPGLLNYQGRLVDSATGDPITSSVNVTFTFFDAEVGGNQLGSGFSDTDAVTPDTEGIYGTLIGDDPGNLVPTSIFESDSVWLNVAVEGENLVPRKRITSVGFALQAAEADRAAAADFSDQAGSVGKVVHDFVVATGESVTAGDVVALINGKVKPCDAKNPSPLYHFNASTTPNIDAARLSESQFVVAFTDTTNSSYGTALIGEIAGSGITWGSKQVFNAGTTSHISIAVLAEDKILLAYQDTSASNYGHSLIGSISGTTFTWGSETAFNSSYTDTNDVAVLTSGTVVVTFREINPFAIGRACVGAISGSSVSWGTMTSIRGDRTDDMVTVPLDETRFLTTYKADSVGQSLGRVGAVSGSTISWGTEALIESVLIGSMDIAVIDTDKAVLAYQDTTASGQGAARIGTVSGTSLTWSSKSVFNVNISSQISISAWTPSEIAVAYRYENTAGSCITGSISGTTFTWGTQQDFLASDCFEVTALPVVAKGWLLIVFRDVGPGNYGAARLFIPDGETADSLLGIADASAGGDETVPVILQGISPHHSGLSVWTDYFASGAGGLTETDNGLPVGRAVSESDLLLMIH